MNTVGDPAKVWPQHWPASGWSCPDVENRSAVERNRVMRPLMLEVGLIVDGQFLSKGENRYRSLAVEASVKALANTLSTAKRRSRNAR